MGQHSAPEDASQIRYPWRTMARTIFQLVVGLAAAMPMLIASTGLPTTAAGIGTALAVSATITRIMAIPAVAILIARYAPWLAAEPRAATAPTFNISGTVDDVAAAVDRVMRRRTLALRRGEGTSPREP
ncbi:hypothetical protein ACW2Q0_00470 [Nocardia sp. R16R-3T]